jgi:hypothetical protein
MLASGVALVAVAGAGIGVASADTSTTPAPPPSSAPAHPKPAHPKKRHPGMLARVEHGQFTLNGKKHRTIDLQRGKVQAITPTSVTVQSADGFTATYTVNGNTKVRKDKKPSTIGQVVAGDRVTVTADVHGPAATADRIGDSGPAPAPKPAPAPH